MSPNISSTSVPPADRAGPDPTAIRLWWIATDRPLTPAHEARLLDLLSPDERARQARPRRPRDRRTYLLAHALPRLALSRQAPRAPRDWRFAVGEHGKPVLMDDGPGFNLSHTDGLAVCAIAPDRDLDLGVDVERQTRDLRVDDLARRWLAPEEQAWLARQPAPTRATGFMRLWTLKEACVKATGRGLAQPLTGFALDIGADDRPRLLRAAPDSGPRADWQIEQWVLEDCWLALAIALAPGAPRRAVIRQDGAPLLDAV